MEVIVLCLVLNSSCIITSTIITRDYSSSYVVLACINNIQYTSLAQGSSGLLRSIYQSQLIINAQVSDNNLAVASLDRNNISISAQSQGIGTSSILRNSDSIYAFTSVYNSTGTIDKNSISSSIVLRNESTTSYGCSRYRSLCSYRTLADSQLSSSSIKYSSTIRYIYGSSINSSANSGRINNTISYGYEAILAGQFYILNTANSQVCISTSDY